jgi:hypothetical protein
MKIKSKFVQNVRIREDRAELLKNKSFELSMKAKFIISESDLVNYLIDKYTEKIQYTKDELSIDNEA